MNGAQDPRTRVNDDPVVVDRLEQAAVQAFRYCVAALSPDNDALRDIAELVQRVREDGPVIGAFTTEGPVSDDDLIRALADTGAAIVKERR